MKANHYKAGESVDIDMKFVSFMKMKFESVTSYAFKVDGHMLDPYDLSFPDVYKVLNNIVKKKDSFHR